MTIKTNDWLRREHRDDPIWIYRVEPTFAWGLEFQSTGYMQDLCISIEREQIYRQGLKGDLVVPFDWLLPEHAAEFAARLAEAVQSRGFTLASPASDAQSPADSSTTP